LHLHLLNKYALPWAKWGPALLAVLLPYARSGGDERALAYCRKLDIEPDPELIEQLVWAYWIRRAARQTECFELRSSERCIDSAIRRVAPVFLEFMARRKSSSAGKRGS
jgi:hypothetical protein